ncbi:MAG: hypothetical protein V4647_11240 [Pseudomonadota bacterium]
MRTQIKADLSNLSHTEVREFDGAIAFKIDHEPRWWLGDTPWELADSGVFRFDKPEGQIHVRISTFWTTIPFLALLGVAALITVLFSEHIFQTIAGLSLALLWAYFLYWWRGPREAERYLTRLVGPQP